MDLSSSGFFPVFTSAARTATATSDVEEQIGVTALRLDVTVTAQSGTSPTLDVVLQGSDDGVNGWYTLITIPQFAAATGTKSAAIGPTAIPRYVRAVATIAGTNPSFTFSANVNAAGGATAGGVTLEEYLAQGPSGRELASVQSAVVQAALGAGPTDITGLSITFTVGARPVWVHAYLPYVASNAATSMYNLSVTDAAGTVQEGVNTTFAASVFLGVSVWERISTPGTYTRKVRAARVLGTGTITVNFDATTTAFIRAVEA